MIGFRGFARFCVVAFVAAGASAGCATGFAGGSHVPGGAAGCSKVCGSYGMDLAGMVAMGEYSDGCVCKVRGQAAAGGGPELAVAGAGQAAVGVVLQARQNDRDAQRATMMIP